MKYFVTGGAGFIGSNIIDRMLSDGHEVVAYDNFSTGLEPFLASARTNDDFSLVEGDLLDRQTLSGAMSGCEFVFHLAANADIRHGTKNTFRDLEQNTLATHNVLEAMRDNNITQIAFASTGPVYGDAEMFPTPENAPFPVQTSLYGASKAAAEGLICAYCEAFGFRGWIFRVVSVLGNRYTHGHVFDFYQKLRKDPTQLHVLGDGHQKKSYIHIEDCIDATEVAIEKSRDKINIFNLGYPAYIEVNDSINYITNHLGVTPTLRYQGGERGWIGDNPMVFLDVNKIRGLGWEPKIGIKEAIVRTVTWLQDNEWVYKARK